MSQYLIFILGLAIGFILAWIIKKPQDNKKEERKEKVLEYLKEKGEIANDEVEKLLGVADTSAYRYLEELEKEGKIGQVGEVGKYVKYRLRS